MIEERLTRAAIKERTEDHAMPVELRGITIRYDGGAEPLVIADDFDLGLEAGTMHCLAGRSGSGKTSILTVAAGLQQPTPARCSGRAMPSAPWTTTRSPTAAVR